ncbi:T cell activation RhoGTPase activating protein b [Conger conger]|uniref:T cell activation RhoGTPase activating protein b n=1 Tax=Conger conger TaxID=82655 RepID=UPI002A5A95F5|nr:T cell activation RhoGTPase activating protein b [Conger conger]
MTVLSGSVTCKTLGGVMDSVIEVPTDGKASAAQKAEPLGNEEGRGCHPIEKMGGGWRHFLQRKRSSAHSDSGPAPREPLLFSQPLSKVCGGDGQLPQPITDMLMLLLKKGVFTEGVFRKAANARSLKEIRELLNSGTEVELESKPVILLAALLKDFLRQIPGSLLVAEEYAAWMATLETKDLLERRAQLRQVIDRLPLANGVLLQHLLCVLHHISRNTTTNKMDANNLSICIGPNLLQHSPEPEVVSKVTDLTQFLIENCCEIFGEQIQSLLGNPDEEELADNLDSLSSHQHDSAYDSTDPDAEGDAPGHHDDVPKPLPRRRSEPALFLSAVAPGSALHGGLLLARSHEDCSGFQERPLQKPASQDSFLRPSQGQRSAPPPLRGSWGGVATSSCSLESSLSNQSEGSVFTSSPLASPAASRRSPFPRQQSLRLPAPPAAPAAPPPQETEKEEKVKRRSQSMRSRGMARVRSWSTFTRGGSLKKADAPQPKEGGAFPCETLPENPASPGPAPARPRPRPLSAIEVFQEVDRRIPGPPPSYDVAPPPQPPPYRTLTVSGARELERRSRPASVSEDFLLPPGPAEDTPTQPEAPPPAAFRLRAMSESVSRGNNNAPHDEANRRCSQPLFEEMLYAKESYV